LDEVDDTSIFKTGWPTRYRRSLLGFSRAGVRRARHRRLSRSDL